MFFTIPPPEALELQVPDNLKAITLRITDIQPSGEINVYSYPHRELWPHTFDAQRSEHRIETTLGRIGIQKMSGAETFDLELVAVEADGPQPWREEEPQRINMLPRRSLLDTLDD